MVRTSDGLSLAVREAGPKGAKSLVFLHGIAQSKRIFEPVLSSPLAKEHHLVAFDLRGHGGSDKPADPAAFARTRLAADLAAVLDGLQLVRPVLVPWSFGGVVVGEYLRQHGEARLGGIVFVAAAARTGKQARALYGPVMLEQASALLSEDAATYEAGAREFLLRCSATPLAPAVIDRAVSEMLRVPPHVRRALLTGTADYSHEIARLDLPVATLHGELDAVVAPAMSDFIAGLRPGIRQERLAGVGHLPWLEAPDPFGAALRSLSEQSDPGPSLIPEGSR